jgi:hypothetical protein
LPLFAFTSPAGSMPVFEKYGFTSAFPAVTLSQALRTSGNLGGLLLGRKLWRFYDRATRIG